MLEKKNDHLPRLLHSSPNLSRSNNSPIGSPHPASNHSCSQNLASWHGHASKLGWSPATAANPWSQSQWSVSSDDSTPMAGGCGLSARACRAESLSWL